MLPILGYLPIHPSGKKFQNEGEICSGLQLQMLKSGPGVAFINNFYILITMGKVVDVLHGVGYMAWGNSPGMLGVL